MSIFQPKNVPLYVQDRFRELAGSVDKLNAATSATNIWFQLKSMSTLCKTEYNNLSNYINKIPFYQKATGAQLQDRNSIALQRIPQSVRTNEVSPFETIEVKTSVPNKSTTQLDQNKGVQAGGAYDKSVPSTVVKIIKPMVDSIKVQKQGELGTTSKCTITIIVSTVGDGMAELQKCFFIPGMSVRVEWGYYKEGSTTPYPIDASDTLTDGEATDAIRKHVEKNKGLYYGLQGRVTNFSWTLESAQYWVCTLEVISAAESKMEAQTTKPCKNKDGSIGPSVGIGVTNTEGEEEVRIFSPLSRALQELAALAKNTPAPVGDSQKAYEDLKARAAAYSRNSEGSLTLPRTIADKQNTLFEELKTNAGNYLQNANDMFIEFQQYEGPIRDKTGSTSGFLNSIGSFFTETLEAGVTETYISFAVLEALISKHVLSDANNNIKQTILSSKEVYLPTIKNKNGVMLTQSVDPRVCIIPGADELQHILDEQAGFDYYKDKSAYKTLGDGKPYVRLSLIRLNVIMLASILARIEDPKKGDFALNSFMDEVLREISTATGNLWDLILTPAPDDKQTSKIESNEQLTIVDVKATPTDNDTGNQAEAFVIPSQPDNSILSDLKLDMKMTSAMRTQALYSPGNSGGMTDKQNPCSGKAARAWSVIQGGSDESINKASKPVKLPNCNPDKSSPEANKSPNSTKITNFAVAMKDGMENGINDSNVNNALDYLQKEMAEMMEDPNHPHCDGVPLPIECTMTFNFGIGGIGFGQLITTTFIPKEIRDKFHWQITSVEHSLTGQGWTMQVNTVPRVKPKPKTKTN